MPVSTQERYRMTRMQYRVRNAKTILDWMRNNLQ